MEPDLQSEVGRVRDKVMELELSTTKKMGEIEATARVTKHDVDNVKQMVIGIDGRIDRFEAQMKSDLKEVSANVQKEVREIGRQLAQDVKKLSDEISSVNVRQEKGASFYAGIIATGGVALGLIGSLLMLLYNQLFGNHG